MLNAVESVQVSATGRRLAMVRAGVGTPTVVLETGLGAESEEWEPVFREVEQLTSVCRYDRANRGQSDPAPKPRSAQDCVADLRALFDAAAIPRPVVLVGHSLGGLIVRLYAHQHPDEVAGLVLVDSMHGDQFERIGPLLPPPWPGEPEALTQLRRFWTAGWRDPGQNNEGIDFVACQTEARTITSLGDLPLIVLSAGAEFLRPAPPGSPDAARLQAYWLAMQGELLQLSSHATQILVETSGHFIQREQPEVIVAAIRQMLEIVRHRP